MKKFYFSLIISAFTLQLSKAQLTLTKANNEAVIGDVESRQHYDSSSTIPKNVGLNQNWSFTSLTINTMVTTKSYSAPSASPNFTAFSGPTIASYDGINKYEMYKSSGSTYELLGFDQPGVVLSLSNTAVSIVWPVTVGYTANDIFSGSAMSGTTQVAISGTIVTNANGTGTVTLPGGTPFSNCLQAIQSLTIMQTFGTATATSVENNYIYFHSSEKFPLLVIHYKTSTTGTVVTKTYEATINKAAFAGIKELNSNNNLSVYPNPAKNYFDVRLTNDASSKITYELINVLGQTVKKEDLGFDKNINARINTNSLQTGIYFVNVKVGETVLTRKLIIE